MLGSILQLLSPLLPFAAAALVIHFCEQLIQARLSRRFGWSSILATGWLGTPVHELSHALMCFVFQHKITGMALFEPDIESGRLGYVRHSYQANHPIQELGNLFIGIAPLFGGSLVLAALFFAFFPTDFRQIMASPRSAVQEPAGDAAGIAEPNSGGRNSSEQQTANERQGSNLLSSTEHNASWNWWPLAIQIQQFCAANLFSIRFWIFMYLALCIASHMAPSWSDYRGAGRAAIWTAVGVLLAVTILSLLGLADPVAHLLSWLLNPVMAVLMLGVMLSLLATIVVMGATAIWDALVAFRK